MTGNRFRQPTLRTVAAAALLAVLAGCGGGNSSAADGTAIASSASANADAADAETLAAQSATAAVTAPAPTAAVAAATTTPTPTPTTTTTTAATTPSTTSTTSTTAATTTTTPAATTTPTATTTTTTKPVTTPTTTPTTPAATSSTTPAIEYFGRFDYSQSAGARFAWSGTSIKARFNGTWVTAKLKGAAGDVNFTAVIDDGTPTVIKSKAGSTTSFTLASGLTAGEHTVLLTRNNEAFNGTNQFLGFEFGGTLMAPAAFTNPLKMEVYGDSIAAALGDMRVTNCSVYSVDDENAYLGYADKAARTLGAQPPTIIAWSGKGVYHNGGQAPGVDTIAATYDRAVGNESLIWNFPADKTPNVVVVALGTNDVNPLPSGSPPTDAALTGGYVAFAKTLRARYPAASLIFTIGPMTFAYQTAALAAVAQLNSAGDSKVYSLIHTANKSPTGCDSHPSEAQHTVMAAELVTVLKKIGY